MRRGIEVSDLVDRSRRRTLKQLALLNLLPALLTPSRALARVLAQAGPPSFQGHRRPFTQVSPPYAAPITPMYTANGGVANLRKYRDKVVLLNFWATWCAPCLYELPALDRLQQDLGGDGFDVVTLNIDAFEPTKAARFFERLGIKDLPLLYDPAGHAPQAFRLHDGLPWTFVIDRRGDVRGYLMGAAEWDSEQARRLLAYYLN